VDEINIIEMPSQHSSTISSDNNKDHITHLEKKIFSSELPDGKQPKYPPNNRSTLKISIN